MIPVKKTLLITRKPFRDESDFQSNRSMDAPSVAAEGLWETWIRKPYDKDVLCVHKCSSFSCVIALLTPLYFNKLHSQLLIPCGCSIILALKALCKVRGGPSWCLTAPAESDPVLLLGCKGRPALLISAELQDLWLKSTHTYQKTSAISHVYLTWSRLFYIIWIFLETVDISGLRSSTGQRAGLIQPKDKHVHGHTGWGEQTPSKIG